MSNEELQKSLAALKALRDEASISKERALALLVEGGFATPEGELTEQYRKRA